MSGIFKFSIKVGDGEVDRERILSIDPHILLSWINMKLRDEFSDIIALCEDYDVEFEEINRRLKDIGYHYNKYINQYKSYDSIRNGE